MCAESRIYSSSIIHTCIWRISALGCLELPVCRMVTFMVCRARAGLCTLSARVRTVQLLNRIGYRRVRTRDSADPTSSLCLWSLEIPATVYAMAERTMAATT